MIWLKFCKNFFRLPQYMHVCFHYIPPYHSVYFNNHEIGYFESLELKVRKYSELGNVSILGDLNARCGKRLDFIDNYSYLNRYIHVLDDNDLYINDFNFPHRFSMYETVNTAGIKLLDLCRRSSLKIVNGRCDEDAGVGSFTNISRNGNCLIDYVLCSQELFPFISEFIVHDVYTFSNHTPIKVSFNIYCNSNNNDIHVSDYCENSNSELRFNDDSLLQYKEIMSSEMFVLNNIVDDVILLKIDLDSGISNISKSF